MRLIDADALIPKGTKVTDDVIAVHTAITAAPTIDAVPVVRCHECQEYDEDNEYCLWLKIYACPFFYCAHSDRKDGDGE